MDNKELPDNPGQPRGRIVYVDYLKALAITLVVLFHCRTVCYNPIIPSIYAICCPLFFVINGFLMLRKETSIIQIVRMCTKIALLIIIYDIAYVLYKEILTGENLLSIETVKNIYSLRLDYSHRLWFLFALFFLTAINPIMRCLIMDEKISRYFFIILALFAPATGFLFWGFNFFKNTYSWVLLYYLFGYIIYKRSTLINDERTNLLFTRKGLIIILIISVLLQSLINYCLVNFYSSKYPSFDYCVDYKFPLTYVITICVFMLISNMQIRRSKIVEWVSKNTLGIYLIHTFPQYYLWTLNLDRTVELFLTLVITTLIVFLLNCTKITNWLISLKLEVN